MTDSPRVLHVITDRDRRGAQVFAIDLASGLDALGAGSTIVALAPGSHDDLLPVHALGPTRRSWRTLRALHRRARAADIVVAHGSATLLACAVALAGTRTPFVYRQISDPLHWAATWPRRVRTGAFLRRAAAIVALSESSAQVVCAHYRLPAARVTVLPNAVPSSRFAPGDPAAGDQGRKQFGVPSDATLALSMSALAVEKGVDMVITAIGQIPELHLLVAGSGPERERLEALAQLVAPDRVVFAGAVTDVVSALQSADMLVLASRGGDSMPAVLIEAGLCGLPTVATPVGAITDVVVDGVTGLITPISDQGALTAVLKRLTTDAPMRHDLGDAARARCLEQFTIEATAPGWLALLTLVRPPRRTDRPIAGPPPPA